MQWWQMFIPVLNDTTHQWRRDLQADSSQHKGQLITKYLGRFVVCGGGTVSQLNLTDWHVACRWKESNHTWPRLCSWPTGSYWQQTLSCSLQIQMHTRSYLPCKTSISQCFSAFIAISSHGEGIVFNHTSSMEEAVQRNTFFYHTKKLKVILPLFFLIC